MRHSFLKNSSNFQWVIFLGMVPWLAAPAAQFQLNTNLSQIEVAVKSTAADFVGRLERYQAKIEIEPGQALPKRVEVSFDFRDLKTGVQGRDQHMLEWLQYSKNASGLFVLKNWEAGADSLACGELTIHGVQKDIRFPVTVNTKGDQIDMIGKVDLDYRDFGLPLIRKALLFKVNPHLTVRFHLAGSLASQ